MEKLLKGRIAKMCMCVICIEKPYKEKLKSCLLFYTIYSQRNLVLHIFYKFNRRGAAQCNYEKIITEKNHYNSVFIKEATINYVDK